MAAAAVLFYRAPQQAEEKDREKHLLGRATLLQAARTALAALPSWSAADLHAVLQALAAEHAEGKLGKIAQPLRVAVAGCAVSPPLDQTLAVLGREETLRRLQHAEAWV